MFRHAQEKRTFGVLCATWQRLVQLGSLARPLHPTGEQIDAAFGVTLGLTTLASAALGNLVADVVGVSVTHTVGATVSSAQGWCRAAWR